MTGSTSLFDADDWSASFRMRLNFLVTMVPAPSSRAWTNELIAEEVSTRGVATTASHIAHLRSGRRSNPSARLVGALAQTFGVPVSFFFEVDAFERIKAQFEALTQLRDAGVRGIAARGEGVDPSVLLQALEALQNDTGRHGDQTAR